VPENDRKRIIRYLRTIGTQPTEQAVLDQYSKEQREMSGSVVPATAPASVPATVPTPAASVSPGRAVTPPATAAATASAPAAVATPVPVPDTIEPVSRTLDSIAQEAAKPRNAQERELVSLMSALREKKVDMPAMSTEQILGDFRKYDAARQEATLRKLRDANNPQSAPTSTAAAATAAAAIGTVTPDQALSDRIPLRDMTPRDAEERELITIVDALREKKVYIADLSNESILNGFRLFDAKKQQSYLRTMRDAYRRHVTNPK
jgi:hypothetical protein